jgi:hypothetical protein
MAEFPSLKQLVEAEIARRAEGNGSWPAFYYNVDRIGGIDDTKAAVAEITANAGSGTAISVSNSIAAEVETALRVKFPRRLQIRRVVVDAPRRHADRPETENCNEERDRAVANANARLTQLRERGAAELGSP